MDHIEIEFAYSAGKEEGLFVKTAVLKRPTKLILFFTIIVLSSVVGLVSANTIFSAADEIYAGVSVGDISVGGLSVPAATAKIAAALQKDTLHSPIVLTYGGQSWTIAPQEIELRVDAEQLAEEAYTIGRTGNCLQRFSDCLAAISNTHSVPVVYQYDRRKLTVILTHIAEAVNRAPRNAVLMRQGQTANIVIAPEEAGRTLNIAQSLTAVEAALRKRGAVSLVVDTTPPTVTRSSLTDIETVIATYTTHFNPYDLNRSENIRLAAQCINHTLLHPGEIFSFNKSVGQRLPEFGYKQAPAYINGKLGMDWGGGVCQVTSTLYNAALLADMRIEERTSHPRPPGYVPVGQDSTVADNVIDLKFKNTSPYAIYIDTELSGDQLTVCILGKKGVTPDITIVSGDRRILAPDVIVKQDPGLDNGRTIVEAEGQSGFMVTTYRIKKVNGQEISREVLSTDTFNEEDRVIRVGTKAARRSR